MKRRWLCFQLLIRHCDCGGCGGGGRRRRRGRRRGRRRRQTVLHRVSVVGFHGPCTHARAHTRVWMMMIMMLGGSRE